MIEKITNVTNDNELHECNDYQLLGSVLLVSFVMISVIR
jgi:hypothetical protein